MALTPDQVKDVIAADAAETKAAKAALIVAQRGAMEAKIQFNFLQAFTGTEGVTRGAVFYACQANWSVLYAYMEAAGLSKTNFDDVVIAFYAVKDSLATDATAGHVQVRNMVRPSADLRHDHIGQVGDKLTNSSTPNYERKTSTVSPRGQVRLPRLPEPAMHLDFTRKEVIEMARNGSLKLALQKNGPAYRDEINRILAGK